MKFSNSLKFNAVAEWWEEYIAYSALKKKIYEFEHQNHELNGSSYEHTETSALISSGPSMSNSEKFLPLLDRELHKVTVFYKSQEAELFDEVDQLNESIIRREEQGDTDPRFLDDGDSDDEDMLSGAGSTSRSRGGRKRKGSLNKNRSQDRRSTNSSGDEYDLEASMASITSPVDEQTSPLSRSMGLPKTARMALSGIFGTQKGPDSVWTSKSNDAWDTRMLFKRRITTLYISATSLKSYVELNFSGFRKILKKFDKITDSDLKDRYMHETVELALPFQRESKDRLNEIISQLIALYAKCITKGDTSAAQKQLKVHQREHIVWERDTVWRQMIGKERRGENDGQVKNLMPGGTVDEESEPLLAVPTPVGRFKITGGRVSLVVALITFVTLLNVQSVDGFEANRCFAILVFATILWATEAIPLFVTSTMIPLLVAVLRVIRIEKPQNVYHQATASESTKFIFSVMFSPTIMLLLGGFTLSSALSKTNIDRILITRVLSLAGTKPSTVILAFMGVSCFASMWISNVAAPALCFTLIRPILSTLPPKTTFAPCLIMAIALAANIGGQSSPISSPQNLIALNEMNPPLDWLQWFAVAIPVSSVSIILIWFLLLAVYRPSLTADGKELLIKPIRPTREDFSAKQYWVSVICIVTIALWCIEHKIEKYVGDMGIIAIIPILAFFGSGVLKKADFDQFLWSIVFLAMGGIALGKAVVSSGLLETMDVVIRDLVDGLPVYEVVWALTAVVLVVSTFISHTIASVLLVPIAAEVGKNLPHPDARMLIFITGLVCSTGMGMPVSGFPNQTAATQEDEFGVLYLSNLDFLKCGVPASVIAAMVVATVGYAIMRLIGV